MNDIALLVGAAMCSACLCGTCHGRWPEEPPAPAPAEVDEHGNELPTTERQQMEEFRADQHLGEIWESWGPDAERNFRVVRHRWNRLRDALPEHEQPMLDDLFDELPPAAQQEALNRLAGWRGRA